MRIRSVSLTYCMALLMPNSLMIHVPKTGGSWCRTAIRESRIPRRELNKHKGAGCRHEGIKSVWQQAGDRFSFGFVRDPLTWAQSRWAYTTRNSKGKPSLKYWSPDFNIWVSSILDHDPDFAMRAMLHRVGYEKVAGQWVKGKVSVDFVGHTENLVEDFIEAMNLAGEVFNPEVVRKVKPKKVCSQDNNWAPRVGYQPEIKKRWREANQQFYELFA